ncbi:MAG: T9SS type A sorting domain-containing protein [Chitinophagaceae bacterium]|nr:T9SS type A sorting domain-containing protein [Chitinophagaceae bacterium]
MVAQHLHPTFAPTVTQNNYQYRCIVTGNCAPFTVTSTAVTLTVNAPPTITSHPNIATVCGGTNAGFSVTATGTGTLTYQWQISTTGCIAGAVFTNLTNTAPYSGATTANLTITGATAGLNGAGYRCIVSGTCTPQATSNCAQLIVNAPPAVTQQPTNLTVCAGNTASFTVAGSNTTGYQWQVNDGTGWVNVGGANLATYSFTAALVQNNYQYRCVISGSCAPTATSNPATLSVATALVISNQPANSTICEGSNTTFNVGITGTVVSYQWQVSTDGGGSYNNLTNGTTYNGVATANLSITAATASMNNYRYRCAVTGSCPTINSLAGILTVNTAPAITSQPVANRIICAAQNTSFTLTATGTAVTYQWQESTNSGGTFTNLSNGGFYSGVNTATLNITGATTAMSTYQYRCVLNGTCSPSVTSTAGLLTVHTPVGIVTQPTNKTVCATGNTSFVITATGTLPTYQWQVSTNGGSTFTNVTGALAATLNLTAVTPAMNGNLYRCDVSGAAPCGSITSGNASLSVSAQPTALLSALLYQNLFPGLTTTLTATSSIPVANASYVWYWNNSVISNTGINYPVTVNNLGAYKVRVTDNINGCTNESNVVVIGDSVSSRLFIYPSPNNGQFNVAYYNADGTFTQQTLAIFDDKGAKVYDKKLDVFQSYQIHNIDLRRNGAGIYFVVLGDANGNKLKSAEVLVR